MAGKKVAARTATATSGAAKHQERRLGRPPSSMSAETRARIVAAGLKCFTQYGYDKTTNKDIADEAGLTTGALYHYFDSKQSLFVAVLHEQQDRILQSFSDATDGVDGAIAKLCAVLERAAELNEEDAHLARFVSIAPIEIDRHDEFRAAPTADGEAPTTTGGIAEFFAAIVAEGQVSGEIDPDVDPASVLLMLLAATSGLAQLAGFVSDAVSHRGAIDSFERLLRGTLMRPQAAEATPLQAQRSRRRAKAG